MHNIIDQALIGVIATVNAIARTVAYQQPMSEAVGQAFSLAVTQLAIDVGVNWVAMYHESWAGVPVIEVWARWRWSFMLAIAGTFVFG